MPNCFFFRLHLEVFPSFPVQRPVTEGGLHQGDPRGHQPGQRRRGASPGLPAHRGGCQGASSKVHQEVSG